MMSSHSTLDAVVVDLEAQQQLKTVSTAMGTLPALFSSGLQLHSKKDSSLLPSANPTAVPTPSSHGDLSSLEIEVTTVTSTVTKNGGNQNSASAVYNGGGGGRGKVDGGTAAEKKEAEWLQRMRTEELSSAHSARKNDFDLLRWLRAYEGDVALAGRKLRRHERLRPLLQLDFPAEEGATPPPSTTNTNGCLMDPDDDQGDADDLLFAKGKPVHHSSEMGARVLDTSVDEYAPTAILGEVSATDHRVLLLEQTGRFDLQQMMKEIKITPFMMNRFILMERILRAIQNSEQRHGVGPLSAVLVIDLHGLSFHPNLVSFISGPYRIMWGNLIEQYPSLISNIIVINAPTFISMLWNACCAFIPAEYKKRIHLLGADWPKRIGEWVPVESLPMCYEGGKRCVELVTPMPCRISPANDFALLLEQQGVDSVSNLGGETTVLGTAVVPAGGILVHTYYLREQQLTEFYMRHEKDCTMNIYYSPQQRQYPSIVGVTPPQGGGKGETVRKGGTLGSDGCKRDPLEEAGLVEAYAGCERPGMPTLDYWQWMVPQTGFYHVVLGNEKAWLWSVTVRYQLYEVHSASGTRLKLQPLPAASQQRG